MTVLRISDLSKSYGPVRAVQNLNLEVQKGEVMGLLGPNGSGKTTTLGIVLGAIRADEGSYEWFESGASHKERSRIGSILENPNFYPYLSGKDNLKIFSRIKGTSFDEIPELIELVGLSSRMNSPIRTYSLGMKQRLALAAALVGDPEVLVLDEPANGLDPQGIAEVRNIIQEIARQGKTIIMASHILDEVEKVCSHVCILGNGRLLASGPVGKLLGDYTLVEIGADDPEKLEVFVKGISSAEILDQREGFFELRIKDEISASEINAMAHGSGLFLNHLVVKKRSLESEFLEITQKQ